MTPEKWWGFTTPWSAKRNSAPDRAVGGGGSGHWDGAGFALAAAGRFRHVTAVDISPAMLKLLRDRAAEAGVTNLECVQAGFLSYEHTRPTADGVYTRNALHQLPDIWKAVALDRIAQMMRPGGVLRLRDLTYDVRPHHADEVLNRWLDDHRRRPGPGPYPREPGRACADRAQHLPVAVGADARRRRVRDHEGGLRRISVWRLHLP